MLGYLLLWLYFKTNTNVKDERFLEDWLFYSRQLSDFLWNWITTSGQLLTRNMKLWTVPESLRVSCYCGYNLLDSVILNNCSDYFKDDFTPKTAVMWLWCAVHCMRYVGLPINQPKIQRSSSSSSSDVIRTRYGAVVWWRRVVATEGDPVRQHLIERARLRLVEQRAIDLLPRHVFLRCFQCLLLHFRAHVNLQTHYSSSLLAVTSFIPEHRYLVFRDTVHGPDCQKILGKILSFA